MMRICQNKLRHRLGQKAAAWFILLIALQVGPAAKPAHARDTRKPVFRSYKHPLTIWVPPYAVAQSKAQLAASFGSIGVKDAVTHLVLQFWTPTETGSVVRVGDPEVTDQAVTDLRDWGHAHGMRVMLCVYNGAVKWDWPLARTAFAGHRPEFVRSLVAETKRLGLDGVDIDLEGPDTFEADRPAFVSFMTDLSRKLHGGGKQLTVDSFQAYQWNAPNQSWWPALFPLVDGLTSMGYDDSGLQAPDWRSYAAQKKAAGAFASKLEIGMPSDKARWRGNTALEQLQWVRQDGTMGVAIWDAQLPSPAWRTPQVWQALKEISHRP